MQDHDDVTRGAYAPIEAGGSAWTREDGGPRRGTTSPGEMLRVDVTAVVLSVEREQPVVLVTEAGSHIGLRSPGARPSVQLPTGRFRPLDQPSLEAALRATVLASTGRDLGYVEQLLTDYGPADVVPVADARNDRNQLSVSYLALMRANAELTRAGARWLECYDLLPWEDFRSGRSEHLTEVVLPALEAWIDAAGAGGAIAAERRERVGIAFGCGGRTWDDQRVVDRYDLIAEAGIAGSGSVSPLGPGHMRLVAAALGRLRGKLRYRPVVFEVLAPEFTLFELQRTVEAVLGPTLHKQNFRRLVEGTGLVEPTGDVRTNTGGRPAKTFRFRREVLLERPTPGVHVRSGRAA